MALFQRVEGFLAAIAKAPSCGYQVCKPLSSVKTRRLVHALMLTVDKPPASDGPNDEIAVYVVTFLGGHDSDHLKRVVGALMYPMPW